jgi:hypothetical protein
MNWPAQLARFCDRVEAISKADAARFHGVYFIVRENEVLYVGQTRGSLYTRLGAARARHGVGFVAYLYWMADLGTENTHRLEMEAAFIDLFRPAGNKWRSEVADWARAVAVALAGTNEARAPDAPPPNCTRVAPFQGGNSPLTARQRQILDFIALNVASGLPPTVREIGHHTGISSTNGVNDHLKALERKGVITRLEKARGILLTPVGKALLSSPADAWAVETPPMMEHLGSGGGR